VVKEEQPQKKKTSVEASQLSISSYIISMKTTGEDENF